MLKKGTLYSTKVSNRLYKKTKFSFETQIRSKLEQRVSSLFLLQYCDFYGAVMRIQNRIVPIREPILKTLYHNKGHFGVLKEKQTYIFGKLE